MNTHLNTLCLITLLGLTATAAAQEGEKFVITVEEKTILDETNRERAREKLPPLKIHPLLMKAARDHTKNMARQEKMEHELDGKGPSDRTKEVGFKSGWIGENVAAGSGFFPKDAVATWMQSKPHRENMLNKTYEYIGIGAARGASGEYYYTQVFGRAPGK
jgi:uncharacterized protein YkwD